jgi:hypothetical protein
LKAIDRSGNGFLYIKQKLPRISGARIKDGILLGPQVREIMRVVYRMKLQAKLRLKFGEHAKL